MIYLNKFLKIEAILLAWTVTYLVYEFLSTNIFRIFKKKKLLEAGNDHMHYALLYFFKSKPLTFVLINLINIIFFIIGIISFYINSSLSFMLYILLFLPYLYLRYLVFINLEKKINLT